MSVIAAEKATVTAAGVGRENVLGDDSNLTIVSIPVTLNTSVCKPTSTITSIATVISQTQGPVLLEKVVVRWSPKAAGESLAFVLGMANMSVDDDEDVMALPNGFMTTTGAAGPFPSESFDVPVPGGLALQLSPVSGDFPSTAFYIKATGTKAITSVHFYLRKKGRTFIKGAGF